MDARIENTKESTRGSLFLSDDFPTDFLGSE